ncbi:unnamed protein product [Brugia timori]|uniref:Uncharacterized protein n=1 Tax=Brugia timori TaxID=42155 RepID=A0A0R3QKQ1_9BILA|nr:unnamed protein product [Brugia timori]
MLCSIEVFFIFRRNGWNKVVEQTVKKSGNYKRKPSGLFDQVRRKSIFKKNYSSIFAGSFLNFVRSRDSLPNLPELALRSNDNYYGFVEL